MTVADSEEESSCGVLSFRPKWMQRFNNTKWFLAVYGLLGTIQAMTMVYWIATLTTFEKRFRIPSKTTGLMLSGNEVSQILLSLFLTYYSGQRNRPVWIAWGVAISAASCFVLALPHFLYGPGETVLALTKEHMSTYRVNDTLYRSSENDGLCSKDPGSEHCEKKIGGEFSKFPAFLVFLSQFILGIGTTLYYALGQTYIDDNAKKTKTPLLLGITLSLRTMGPAFGFLIGSACLSVFIEPSLTPVIGKDDPRWLGAWWLGWVVFGFVMLLFSGLIALFPKHIKNSMNLAIEPVFKDTEIQPEPKSGEFVKYNNHKMALKLERPTNKAPSIKDFPAACKRLLKNKLLIINIFSGVFYILGATVYITYLSKYLEVQFNKSPSDASVLLGPVAILSVVGGFLVSGIVITKFKPSPHYLLGWNVIVGVIFIIGELSYTGLSCKDNGIVGYNLQNNSVFLGNECNAGCGCDYVKYSPVCLEEYKMTFYSPCHAGCSVMKKEKNKMFYYNCSCIPAINGISNSLGGPAYQTYYGALKSGSCQFDCGNNFLLYFLVTCAIHFFGASGKIGNVLVNYRAVKPEDKAFAQGLSLLLISLVAFIPGPIIYGIIIDSTCLVWDESCGSRGNCWFYDKDTFRFALNGTAAGITVLGVLLDIVVWYLGRDIDLYCEEIEGPAKTKPKQKKYTADSDNEDGPLKFSYLPNSDQ